MLEKVTDIAQQTATNLCRRGFLAYVGQGAAATVAALSGLIAQPNVVHAGKRVQTCSSLSVFDCIARHVGDPCGNRGGKCVRLDKKDKSEVVDCVCGRQRGRKK